MTDDLHTHRIPVRRTARYFTSTRPADCRDIVLGLHGYAQDVAGFGKAVLPALQPYQWLVVPEGLSRFYRRGVQGDVVASWMTREDREFEIADQAGYLTDLMTRLRSEMPYTRLRIVAFSQGVATACRWLAGWDGPIHQLILWAGTPPEEHYMAALAGRLTCPADLVLGYEDEYIAAKDLDAVLSKLGASGFPYHLHRFAGRHTLEETLLRRLLSQDHNGAG